MKPILAWGTRGESIVRDRTNDTHPLLVTRLRFPPSGRQMRSVEARPGTSLPQTTLPIFPGKPILGHMVDKFFPMPSSKIRLRHQSLDTPLDRKTLSVEPASGLMILPRKQRF